MTDPATGPEPEVVDRPEDHHYEITVGGVHAGLAHYRLVGDGRVFVAAHATCQQGHTATLYALDAAAGDESWRATLVGPYLTVGGVAADDAGTVAVVAHSPAYLKVPAEDLCLEQQGDGLVFLTRFDALSSTILSFRAAGFRLDSTTTTPAAVVL